MRISVPPAVLGPLLDSAWPAFVVLSFSNVSFAFITATGVTALLTVVPARIRAQTVALYYRAISLSGLIFGPTLVPALNDWVFGTDGVRHSIDLQPAIFGLPVLAMAPVTLPLYRRALAEKLAEN